MARRLLPERGAMLKALSLIAAAMWISACSRAPVPLSAAPLTEGGTVARLLPARGTTVALVVRPSDVFNCYQPLWAWNEWRRQHPGGVVLLFTREPTPEERRQLVLRRVRPDAVLAPGGFRPAASPAEYVVARGRVVRATTGRFGTATANLLRGGPATAIDELLTPAHPVGVSASGTPSTNQPGGRS